MSDAAVLDNEKAHPLPAEFGREVFRCQVGSGIHGVTISGYDDRDEMGMCIERPEFVIGLSKFEQYIYRTQAEGVRSGYGDLDLTVYSLRKWTRLALAGNPTVLMPLFVPDSEVVLDSEVGKGLRAHPDRFLSRRTADRFIGYMVAQREQMLGLRGKKHTNRPELVAVHGFDCYLDDTEFLTRRGWLTYDQIEDGEPLGTVSQQTGEVEFQIPTDRVAKPYTGPILSLKGVSTNWAVTPNHRMHVSQMRRGNSGANPRAYDPAQASWGFHRAAEITRFDWYQQVAGARRAREFPVSDAYLALMGAYVSEGCVGKRRLNGEPSVLRMEQKDGGRLHATMALAGTQYRFRTYTYPSARPVTIWTLADREVAKELAKSCGEGSAHKHLPEWVLDLSARQADILIGALLSGDGTPLPNHQGWIYYTNSRRLADDMQAVAVIGGRRSVVMGPYSGIYQVRIKPEGVRTASMRGRDVRTVEVTDARIVCFTVPNETLVTRRDGKVAMHGNTKFAYHMVRLGLQGVELLTTGRITLPMPEPDRTWLRELREGKHVMAEALNRAVDLEDQLRTLRVTSGLPDYPDYARADRWLIGVYQREWQHMLG